MRVPVYCRHAAVRHLEPDDEFGYQRTLCTVCQTEINFHMSELPKVEIAYIEIPDEVFKK